VFNWTEPSQALRKEKERMSVAISVGKVVRVIVWNRDDSHGGRASRKSEKAPGGGGGGVWSNERIGCWIFQPLGDGRMETGTDVGGTWKLENACMEYVPRSLL
jgi:hypothetical protein